MNKSKGFTIIELIVVIAIIAVLAAIVLVNVTQYINKGKDASIKGNLSSMMTIAASYYDDNTSNYIGLDNAAKGGSSATFVAGVTAVNDANGTANDVSKNITSSKYCVQSALLTGGNWCVDSTGYKGTSSGCDGTNYDCQ